MSDLVYTTTADGDVRITNLKTGDSLITDSDADSVRDGMRIMDGTRPGNGAPGENR